MGRQVGGGSCLGTHVRIKDFKIKKNKEKNKKKRKLSAKQLMLFKKNINLFVLIGG